AVRRRIDLVCFDSVLPATDAELLWRSLGADVHDDGLLALVLGPPSARVVRAALPAFYEPKRHGLVSKPIDIREFAREVARLLSSRPSDARRAELLRVGSIALDGTNRRLLFERGGVVPLTPTECRLVSFLMRRPGEFVSTEELLLKVWKYPPNYAGPEVVRAHVSNLRGKLRAAGQNEALLRTIPYRGYGFVAGADGR
ncbi:MAG: winged helix-turn-helix domain-containing protein, partial [Dehalococcoidia bacterium]|nr:winged helix-turn-helix domain-containing protein [Dehalococcoidia bacterium]